MRYFWTKYHSRRLAGVEADDEGLSSLFANFEMEGDGNRVEVELQQGGAPNEEEVRTLEEAVEEQVEEQIEEGIEERIEEGIEERIEEGIEASQEAVDEQVEGRTEERVEAWQKVQGRGGRSRDPPRLRR